MMACLFQSFVIHVHFYSGLLLSTGSLVYDNTSSIQCLMVYNIINTNLILTSLKFKSACIYIYIYIYMHIKLKSAKYLKKIVPTVQMRLDMATREAEAMYC